MTSLRGQIFAYIETKLGTVKTALGWQSLLINPREAVGEDQMNALAFGHGGDREPEGLTGHVESDMAEFSVGMVVMETGSASVEEMLDAGYVAVCDTLTDPADIQLGGLASDVRRGAVSSPYIGRSKDGARVVGVQVIDFTVAYLSREGDASSVGP